MDIKALADIVGKWTARVAISAPEYEAGVRSPKRDWAGSAMGANDSWKAGVQDAIARNAFFAGVRAAGTPKWQERTLTIGVPRWIPGVAAAGPQYEKGFAPFHSALAALALPMRYARGDARNYERVKKIGDALHKIRLGLLKR